jgi:integrase
MVEIKIDTPAKRSRLAPRRNPYWKSIAGGRGGVSLGYRRPERGIGAWIAKTVLQGKRAEEKIGDADDAPGKGGVDYKTAVAKALEWSSRQHIVFDAKVVAAPSKPTVKVAVETYIEMREKLSARHGRNARGRLAKHVLADAKLSNTRLSHLNAGDLESWRDGLEELAPATVNRLANDFRAALNGAGVTYRRQLPAHFIQEVRVGLKRLEEADIARRQILRDEQIVELVSAAFEVDDTGDFGRLITLLAATGARHSQVARVLIEGFQHNQQRVLVPSSRKGRGRIERPPIAIQLSPEVCERLQVGVAGRGPEEFLLTRWHWSRKGRSQWERVERRGWGAQHEAQRYWPDAIRIANDSGAKLPENTVMYAFRHSSIVRGLRANLPVRLVAALHDTSVEMIESHYSAFIVDATEELARRASLVLPAASS